MIRTWFARHRDTISHWSMEVVIVVIGILIAFALQGWSEERASAARTADAERRIRGELLGNAEKFVERIAIYPCLRANAQSLLRGLIVGDAAWRPKTYDAGRRQSFLRIVYPVPVRSLGSDVYRGALAADELGQAVPERRAELAALYRASDQLDVLNREENELTDRLQLLQLDVKLSPAERNGMLSTLARLDSINGLVRLVSRQYLDKLRAKRMSFSTDRKVYGFSREDWKRDLAYMRGRYGSCVDEWAIDVVFPHTARSFDAMHAG